MPLEIRELVIRTSVVNEPSALGRNYGREDSPLSDRDQAAIIAACIEQVLAILQARSER